MTNSDTDSFWKPQKNTAVLVFADGSVLYGKGLGAVGAVEGEVCFNTSLTGYEEILTDPSYQGQIITFTFPHIGIVGTNKEDIEDLHPEENFGAVGAIFKADITKPSNYRAFEQLDKWLEKRGIISLCNIDTRALTVLIREKGALNAVIAHNPSGEFCLEELKKRAKNWSGLIDRDLAKDVTSKATTHWSEKPWSWQETTIKEEEKISNSQTTFPLLHVVAIDFGIKRNILRLLAALDVKITIVPAKTSAKEILALNPDGVFLSNGPGDPAATAEYALPVIQKIIEENIPLFGICLGHQLLALAMGGKTLKMHQGHHGANHPVKDYDTGKVEIVSMNHGFAVDMASLPASVKETHISLFDQTNCGIALLDKPAFSVQYHPEASPGPQDSFYLFQKFYDLMKQHKNHKKKD